MAVATPEELLVRNFYEWEQRGRGWALYPAPVDPEPPFMPFFHVLPDLAAADDGRVESFWSAIVRGIASWLGNSPAIEKPETQTSDVPDSEPNYAADDSTPTEIEIALPSQFKLGREVAEQFLTALTYCRGALGFEIVGSPEHINIQFACCTSDREPLRQQLSAYFPEAVLTERPSRLEQVWRASGENSLIVDFGLSREFFIPLKTYSGFEVDPLVGIVGALGSLREKESGILQVIFQPTRNPWAESIWRSVTDGQGKSFFANAPELLSHARQKIGQPLYAAGVRLGVRAESDERMWEIARGVGSALAQFGSPSANELIPLTNDEYDDAQHEQNLLRRQSCRSGMLLNVHELVSLVHLPSSSVRSPKLLRLTRRTKASPKPASGHELVLGANEHDGETNPVSLTTEQRTRHMHVIGASGTGKSTFLLNLILQDIERGNGLAVIDPHGDLIEQILERIPEERTSDVVLFDPSDENYPIGFNILAAHSEIEKHLLSSDLVSVFKRLSTSWGDQMTSVLGNAILAFLESDRGGTLAELRRFLVEKEYRAEFLKSVRDPEVVYYWQREFPLLAGKPQAPLLTRLDTFLRPKLIRHIVAQRENRLDFAGIMNEGKIFLAKLAQGAIGEENAYLLGSLLVSKFHQTTLSRQEIAESDRRPFFLYLDEFHNFITPSMTQILSGARKFRLGLILAHQELRQLGGIASELMSAVLSNPYTRVCFRVGDEDARKLDSGFSFFEVKDLQNLGTGEAICRIERADFDFNLRTDPLANVERTESQTRREKAIQSSRKKYASELLDVEAELVKGYPSADQKRPMPEALLAPTIDQRSARVEHPSSEATPTYDEALKMRGERRGKNNGEEPIDVLRTDASKGPLAPPTPAPLGRGGREHQYLQQHLKQWATGMGWSAVIEKPILDGLGSVDLVLHKGTYSLACEISITTGIDHEVGNLEKCLKADFTHVAVVSPDPKHLKGIREAALSRFGSETAKLHFCGRDDLIALVESLEAQIGSVETRVKGYKVKRTFKALKPSERDVKKSAITKVLGDTLRQNKIGDKSRSDE